MKLSIIIVNWNTSDLLLQCLAAIYRHPPVVRFELIVIDNGSVDGSVTAVKEQFPQVHLLKNRENVGFARANNQAIQYAVGEYLLLLNSDTVMLPGSLNALLHCAQQFPDAAVFGGRLLNANGSFQAGGNDFPSLMSELLLLTGLARWVYSSYYPSYSAEQCQQTRDCDWVGGAYFLIRRTVVERLGGLDEGYFMYTEEADWCFRVQRAGWRVIYCAEAPLIHLGGGSSSRQTVLQLQRLYASKARFLELYRGKFTASFFRFHVRMIALGRVMVYTFLSLVRPTSRAKARTYWQLVWVKL